MSLTTGDRTYTLGDDGRIQPLGMYINIGGTSSEGKGLWLAPKKLSEAKVVHDTATMKSVKASWELTEGSPRYRLDLELEVREGIPALFVKSHVRRLSEDSGSCYYYWGFSTPVTHYISPGAKPRDFPNEWSVLPGYRWLLIAQRKSGGGFGVITDGKVGRAPESGGDIAKGEVGGYPYFICTPRTENLSQGESLDVSFAVFAARDPREVETVYRKVGKLEPDRIVFDFQKFSRQAMLEISKPKAAVKLSTRDGLTLLLSRDGRVADVRIDNEPLSPPTPALSGFLLRDFTAKSPLTPICGIVRKNGSRISQSAKCMNIEVKASYSALPDRIDVHCDLKDLTGSDRAVTVYFALPVKADPTWQWHDDIEHTRDVSPDEEYLSAAADSPIGANGKNSLYPFATLGSRKAAIAFCIPMDQPRVCRMVYNSETQQFFIAFDLALVSEVKKWPSSASVEFSLFTHDPTWGFRACAKKYYTMFPQFFTKRVKRDGGWVCWGNCADVPNVEELGYAYHWGLAGPEAAKWDNDHGIYIFPYVEATNMHQTMEEFTSATSDDVIKRLKWIADPNRKEVLPQWKYDHPYSSVLGDRDAALRKSAQAYLNSLMYDEHGHIYGSASKTEFDLLIAKYIPCNANPHLPDGLGAYFLDTWLPKVLASFETKGGKVDGIGQDNYHVGDTALSRRREQFPYETIPLTFETKTAKPVIVKNFTTYEFTSEFKRRNPDKLAIANTCSAQFPFTYQLLDIPGYEWGIENIAAFARTTAYHKPVCSLPVQDRHKEEKWIKWHVRYGFFPGGYGNYQTMLNRDAMKKYVPIIKELSQAGWEPVTCARCDDPDIGIERFGSDHFTIFNRADTEKRLHVIFDFNRLKVSPRKASDLITGATYQISERVMEMTLTGKDVVAVRLGE